MSIETHPDTRVAFLRGVNVGGRNRLRMADLRDALSAAGFDRVRTHIQSGNVVFEPGRGPTDEVSLADLVADAVEDAAGFRVPVVVRTLADVASAAAGHPDAASEIPSKWLHVWFLSTSPTSGAVGDPGDLGRFAPDRLVVADRVAYATYPDGVAGSKLTIDVVERAFGLTATARNVATLGAVVALGRSS